MDNKNHFPEGHSPKYWKKHPESLKAARAAAKAEVIGDSAVGKGRPKALEYVITRAGGSFLGIAGVGIGLMLAGYFIPGVAILYFGLFLFAFDVAYEGFVRRLPLGKKVLCGLIYALIVFIASDFWIFRPAPFEVMATSEVPAWGSGTNMEGIDWHDEYSDLNFHIRNLTDMDYDNFDAEVSTDLVIANIRQFSALSQCDIATVREPFNIHWQSMNANGKPVGPADNPNVAYTAIPMDKNGKPIRPPSGGADSSYRIRCEKIPAHSHFDFFGALEVVVGRPEQLFGAPRAASFFNIKASFQTRGRNRSEAINQCVIGMTPCDTGDSRSLLGRWFSRVSHFWRNQKWGS